MWQIESLMILGKALLPRRISLRVEGSRFAPVFIARRKAQATQLRIDRSAPFQTLRISVKHGIEKSEIASRNGLLTPLAGHK
jgi:hypothetical protein